MTVSALRFLKYLPAALRQPYCMTAGTRRHVQCRTGHEFRGKAGYQRMRFVAEVFAETDALLAPVIPEPAPALDAVKAGTVEEVVARMGRFSRLTRPFNGLGLPALSVPCGFSPGGRPLALQVVGRPFDEATVLRLGHAYERATDWVARRPPLL